MAKRNQKDTDSKLHALIPNTLSNYLPLVVIKWVEENIRFEYQNGSPARTFSRIQFEQSEPFRLKPIEGVVFICDNLLNWTPKRQQFIILHEIAHFWLKHHGSGKTELETENEANQLAEKWTEKRKN